MADATILEPVLPASPYVMTRRVIRGSMPRTGSSSAQAITAP